MRAVIQRVKRASVRVEGQTVAEIGAGVLALVGVHLDDAPADAEALAAKIAHLRIFADEAGKMNRSLLDVGGDALVVSQFTLCGDARKGRRPSYASAAPPPQAEALYEAICERLREQGVAVSQGCFGAMMEVELVNAGPVIILLDTQRVF